MTFPIFYIFYKKTGGAKETIGLSESNFSPKMGLLTSIQNEIFLDTEEGRKNISIKEKNTS